MIELGKRYRDMLSGFEGVATGRAVYLHGCPKVLLEGVDSHGKPDELWFAEERIEFVAGRDAAVGFSGS